MLPTISFAVFCLYSHLQVESPRFVLGRDWNKDANANANAHAHAHAHGVSMLDFVPALFLHQKWSQWCSQWGDDRTSGIDGGAIIGP